MASAQTKRQAKRRRSPLSIGGRDPSLRWPHLYDILRSKGHSKETAARISNSRRPFRKRGRIQGLPWQQALHAKDVVVSSSSLVVFACYSKACAPPPIGSGGSNPGGKSGSGGSATWSKTSDRTWAGSHGYTISKIHRTRADTEGRGGGGVRYAFETPDGKHTSDGFKTLKEAKAEADRDAELSKPSTPKFKPITAAEGARGDSKPVSAEEFQRLATIGQSKLDGMADRSSPINGLDEKWDTVKAESYAEAIQSWGGATIDSHTGEALPQGANKYALTVKDKGFDTVSIPEGSSRADFDSAMDNAKEKFRSILEREDHHLGVFHDDDLGRIDIDPVLVVSDLSDVHTIGAATRAIGGAYNFADGNGYWPPHVKEGG